VSATEELVKELAEDAYCRTDRSYGGSMDYTILGKNRRLSLTRFTEEKAWQETLERLTGELPMLGDLK
jgi:hypothetical protein